jgi:hypothetical protein
MTGAKKTKSPAEKDTAAKPQEIHWVVGLKEICHFFSISHETLANWRKRGCPQEAYGKYDLQKVVFWKFGALNESSDEARKIKADMLRAEFKAQKEKIQLEELAGHYMNKDEVEIAWASRVAEVKAGLMCLPRELAAEFTDAPIQRTVEAISREKVYSLLEAYYRDGKYTPEKRTSRVVKKGK